MGLWHSRAARQLCTLAPASARTAHVGLSLVDPLYGARPVLQLKSRHRQSARHLEGGVRIPVVVLRRPLHHVVEDVARAGDADDAGRQVTGVAVADPDPRGSYMASSPPSRCRVAPRCPTRYPSSRPAACYVVVRRVKRERVVQLEVRRTRVVVDEYIGHHV